MKTQYNYLATTLISMFFSSAVLAHDPSMHSAEAEKPNCEAMKTMDHSTMNLDDPVTIAMMEKCKPHSATENVEAETLKKIPLDKTSGGYRAKIGHDAPMNADAPAHERIDHRKVYEVPDCENMSNMYHTSTDQYSPTIQEMMKRCEDAKAAEKEAASDGEHEHD